MTKRPKLQTPSVHRREYDQRRTRRRSSSSSDDDHAEVGLGVGSSSDLWCSLAVTFLLLIIFLRTLHPSIPGGDSGELILSAYELGVAHPPGYPTFTILSKLAISLIPFGSPAWRVNLLNAVLSAVAGGILQFTVLRVTGCVGSSVLSVALFSLSRLTWTWSVTAEVFGLNNLFIAVIMLLSVLLEESKETKTIKKYTRLGALVCGLALTNQHTAVIYVACIALWVLLRLKSFQLLGGKLLLELASLFIFGLLPYIYLPISSTLNMARWTWGDQSNLSGFLTHILRSEYGTFQLGKGHNGLGFTHGVMSYWEHIMTEFTAPAVLLVGVGSLLAVIWFYKRKSSVPMVFLAMVTVYVLFFAWRANLDISNALLRGVVERFWIQSDLVLAFLAGLGFSVVTKQVTTIVFGGSGSARLVLTFIGSAVILAIHMRNYVVCDQSGNYVVHDFAKQLLENLPQDAVVFTKGDLPTNSMRYLHLCEKIRPDVQLLDVEILTYKWSLPKLRRFYPRLRFPGDFWHLTDDLYEDGQTSFSFKTLLDANEKYPMFACIGMQDRDPSWQGTYTLWPYGVCHKIVSARESMNPKQWASVTGGLSDDWTYPFDDFDETSWEKVANDEMWNAKISTAFFMYQEAEFTKDPKVKGQLYYQAYELYFRAIKFLQPSSKLATAPSYPSFWHKNFALVCEKLLHIDHNLDKTRLCKHAITHFKQYASEARDDPEKPKILEAVETLKQRLGMYEKFEQVDQTLDRVAERAERTAEMLNRRGAS